MKALTSSDRTRLLKLAQELPKGSDERRAILAGLKKDAGRAKVSTSTEVSFYLSLEYDPSDPSILEHISTAGVGTPKAVAYAVLENQGIEALWDAVDQKIDGLKIRVPSQFDSINSVKITRA